jgi:hypothetical protein
MTLSYDLARVSGVPDCVEKKQPRKCHILCFFLGGWGHAVAQLVEALRYKPEGRGFDYRW